MDEFKTGDKVTARYGALLDDDGQPMVSTVLHESPHPGDDGVLIRYRCTDGSATDSWVKAEHLERAGRPAAGGLATGPDGEDSIPVFLLPGEKSLFGRRRPGHAKKPPNVPPAKRGVRGLPPSRG